MVVVTHSMYYGRERLGSPHFYLDWVSGVSGVDLFFVISGFVMICSSRNLFDKLDGWKAFSFRRITRIVPLYWLATTAKLGCLLIVPGLILHARLGTKVIVLSYLFLPTRNVDGLIEPLLGVGWTLTFEMFFYFVFALALFLRVNVFRFVGAVMILCALGSIVRRPWWPPATVYLNDMVLDFLFGMFLAHLCHIRRILPPKFAIPLLITAFAVLWSPWSIPGPRCVEWGFPAFVICWCAVSLEQVIHNRIPTSLLFLGDASYVLYLFHPLIAPAAPFLLAKVGLHSPLVSVAISTAISVIVSSGIYKFIDVPIMKWSRQLSLSVLGVR